jgi:phosphoglucosamine mutase
MGRLFGTDGVRGLANAELTPELAMGVAVSAAHVLSERSGERRPVVVVGRDGRASGEMLEAAVIAGLTSDRPPHRRARRRLRRGALRQP